MTSPFCTIWFLDHHYYENVKSEWWTWLWVTDNICVTSLTWVKSMSANNCYGYLPFMGFIQKIALYVQYPEYIQCPPHSQPPTESPQFLMVSDMFCSFFMNRGKGSETKITLVELGCVLRILQIYWSKWSRFVRKRIHKFIFSGTVCVNVYNGFAMSPHH